MDGRSSFVKIDEVVIDLWNNFSCICVFKSYGFGDFIVVDEGTTFASNMQWALLLVMVEGIVLPKSLQVVVGEDYFSVQL